MSTPYSDLTLMTAHALSQAIHRKQVSCREVMAATLARIERINPSVNAIVSLRDADVLLTEADLRDAQLARGQSMGWLHGMPQAIKDLSNTAGLRTTLGSPLMRDFVPAEDGLMAARMKAAGCIVIGKTNTPEFGLGSHTFNEVFGATRNAFDLTKSAGGSSGGAAVARRWRWLSACCRWPMARTSWAACATPPAGTMCLVCGPRKAVCPCGPPTMCGWRS